MKCWHKPKEDFKYDVLYLFYIIMAVYFYMGQNSADAAGERGLHSLLEFSEEILYHDMGFLRVIILPPLCILLILHVRYYLCEQFIIRQKSRRQIYFRILWECVKKAVLFSIVVLCVIVCIGNIYYENSGLNLAGEAVKLLFMIFLIFLCMMVVTVSMQWLTEHKAAGIILVCLFGFYDMVTGYSGLHIFSAAFFISIIFLTAEKKEFYGEKYKND